MSIFVSPQDYIINANDCEQFVCDICGHNYKMWCKKDKIEQVKYIVEKIKPIIEKVSSKNQVLTFDKILFMAMVDILAKDKDFKIESDIEKKNIDNKNDFEFEIEKQKTKQMNEFIEILTSILKALNE